MEGLLSTGPTPSSFICYWDLSYALLKALKATVENPRGSVEKLSPPIGGMLKVSHASWLK